MNKNHMDFDTRNTKIYRDIYRPSSKLSRFIGTILSVLIVGQSPVNTHEHHYIRKSK